MKKAVEAQEQKKSAAARAKSREEEAQMTDEMDALSATMLKATNRLTELADYLGKIEKAVDVTLPKFIDTLPLGVILDAQIAFEGALKLVSEQVKLLDAHVSKAREVMLPGRLDNDETRTVNAASGARMSRSSRTLAGIRAGMKEDAFEWLRKPIIYEIPTVEEQQIIAGLRKRIEEGDDTVTPDMFPLPRPAHPWRRLEDGTIDLIEGFNDEAPDYGSLISETVNASSLSSLAKELLEVGKELPDHLFNVHTKDGVSITKGKGTPKPKKG